MPKLVKVLQYIAVVIIISFIVAAVAANMHYIITGVEEDFREALVIDEKNPLTMVSDDGKDSILFCEDTSHIYINYTNGDSLYFADSIHPDSGWHTKFYDIGVGSKAWKFGNAYIYADTVEIRGADLVIIYGDAEMIRRSEDD